MRKVFYLFILLFFTFLNATAQSWQTCYDSSMYYFTKTYYSKANMWGQKVYENKGDSPEKIIKSLDLLIDINLELNNSKSALFYLLEKVSILEPLKKKKTEYFKTLLDLSDTYSSNDQIPQADSILTIAETYAATNTNKKDLKDRSAALYMDAGKWEQADTIIEEENITNLNVLVRNYIHQGDYEYAEEQILSALNYYKKGTEGYKRTYINSFPSILALSCGGEVYDFNSQEFQLDSVFLTSEKIFKDIFENKSNAYFNLLLTMGNTYAEKGKNEKADSLYSIVYDMSVANLGKYNSFAVDALFKLANRHSESGQLMKAQNIFEQLDILAKEVFGEKSVAYGDCLLLLLYFDIHLGRYEDGLKKYQKIYPIYVKELGKQSASYSSLISVYSVIVKHQSNYSQAASLVREAIDITEKNGVDCNPCYSNLLISLARIQEEVRQYKEAEETYLKVLAFLEKNIHDPLSSSYYHDYRTCLADFYAHCNALSVLDQLKYYPGDTMVQKNGYNYIVSKSSDPKAFSDNGVYELYNEAIRFYSDKYSSKHPQVADLKIRKAIFSWIRGGDRFTASREFREGLNEYLDQIYIYFPQMSEKEKTEFYNTLSDHFNSYYAFVLNSNRTDVFSKIENILYFKNLMDADTISYSFIPTTLNKEPAIKIQENFKANMFNYRLPTKAIIFNSSNQIKKRILTSGDSSLIKEYKKWEQTKVLLAKLYTTGGEERKKYQSKIDSIEASLNQLERSLSESSEHFRNKQEEKEYTWKDIQKKLKKDEAAVEIIRLNHPLYYQTNHSAYKDSVYYAAAIITSETTDNPIVLLLKNGAGMENKHFNYYKNCIKYKIEDKTSYQAFWGQIGQELYSKKTIYVSTDGVYNLINLSTLKNPYGNFLLGSTDIRIVTNLKDLLQPVDTIYKNKNAAIFGDPDFKNHKNKSTDKSGTVHERSIELETLLRGGIEELPGTKIETEKIYKLLSNNGWKPNLLQRNFATEDTLKSVNNIRLLHLATHGFFISNPGNKRENPLLHSGLLFAAGQANLKNNEDGILTSYEAMNLNLENTELVVLSACETGLGEVKNGEGVYGLQRAFRISGAQAMIMSLWKINDAVTSEFMGLFYEYWMKSGDKMKAFRNAQMQIKIKYKDPYYWGAFIMIGS